MTSTLRAAPLVPAVPVLPDEAHVDPARIASLIQRLEDGAIAAAGAAEAAVFVTAPSAMVAGLYAYAAAELAAFRASIAFLKAGNRVSAEEQRAVHDTVAVSRAALHRLLDIDAHLEAVSAAHAAARAHGARVRVLGGSPIVGAATHPATGVTGAALPTS